MYTVLCLTGCVSTRSCVLPMNVQHAYTFTCMKYRNYLPCQQYAEIDTYSSCDHKLICTRNSRHKKLLIVIQTAINGGSKVILLDIIGLLLNPDIWRYRSRHKPILDYPFSFRCRRFVLMTYSRTHKVCSPNGNLMRTQKWTSEGLWCTVSAPIHKESRLLSGSTWRQKNPWCMASGPTLPLSPFQISNFRSRYARCTDTLVSGRNQSTQKTGHTPVNAVHIKHWNLGTLSRGKQKYPFHRRYTYL